MSKELERDAINTNKQADRLFKSKQYSEAIRLYTDSVAMMKEAGNAKKEAEFQKELDEAISKRAAEINTEGDALFKQKNYPEAMKVYESAWVLLQRAGEKWINKYGKEFKGEWTKSKIRYSSEILKPQAEGFVKEKNWQDANKIYGEIMTLITPEVDEKAHRNFLHDTKYVYERWAQEINTKGDEYYKAGQIEDAISAYVESVKYIELSDNEKRKAEFKKELAKAFSDHAQAINTLGDRMLKEKNFQKAAEIYAQSVEIAKNAGNQKLVDNFSKEMQTAYAKFAQQINEQGDALFKQKKYENAAKIYENSVEIAKESKDLKLIKNFQEEFEKAMEKWAHEVNVEGDQKMQEKNFDEAMRSYKKALDLIKRTDNPGRIKNYQGEYLKACLRLAESINKEADNLFTAKQYETAYKLYDRSVVLAEEAGDKGKVKSYTKERNKALEKLNQ